LDRYNENTDSLRIAVLDTQAATKIAARGWQMKEKPGSSRPTADIVEIIEAKLATGRFKDWGEIVDLIRRIHLSEDFALQLDPSLRSAYKQCFDQATDPNYGEPGRS
jgi:hypothetical protein